MNADERKKSSRKLNQIVTDSSSSDSSISEEEKASVNKRSRMGDSNQGGGNNDIEMDPLTKEPVGALIVLNIDEDMEVEWGSEFKKILGESKTTLKFTKNKNILIFPENVGEYNSLNGREIYLNSKKYTIHNLVPKTPELVLKGLTFSQANKLSTQLSEVGLRELKEMKSRANPEIALKRVRVQCESQEKADNFINNGIILNYQKFHFEPFRQKEIKVIQCFKCQALGHIASNCKRDRKCVVCSDRIVESGDDNHKLEDGKYKCNKGEVKCLLCNEKHSNAYDGCFKKKEKLNELIKIKKNDNNHQKTLYSNIHINKQKDQLSVLFENKLNQIIKLISDASVKYETQLKDLENRIGKRFQVIEKDLTFFKQNMSEMVEKVNEQQIEINNHSTVVKNLASALIEVFLLSNKGNAMGSIEIEGFQKILQKLGYGNNNHEWIRKKLIGKK